MWTWFYKLASPPYVYGVAARLMPWLFGIAALTIGYGLIDGLAIAPRDYQQGEAFRMIYVHVPAAILSVTVYTIMAAASAVALIWRIKVGHAVAAASAPIGASFTLMTLVTGSLWGKPMWGTYWAWDPRLTSELILLFLYIGVMSLRSAFEDPARGDRAAALLSVVGVVNVPIVHFSVVWWNSLHQAPTRGHHPGFHFHIELHPPLRRPHLLKYLAGPEVGGGSFISDTSPELTAAELRGLSLVHHKER